MLKKINAGNDFNIIQEFFDNNIPYSDFSAISLVSWSHGKDVFYSLTDEGLIVKMPTYLGEEYIYSAYLLQFNTQFICELKNLSNKFHYVPESSLKYFPDTTIIKEDRDAFDYIYIIEKLANIDKDSNHLAQHIHKFEAAFSNITYRKINLLDNTTRRSLLELCMEWCMAKNFNTVDTASELYALNTYFKYSTSIKDFSVGIFDGDKLIAYTLNELHGKEWVIGHFGKSSYSYKHSSLLSEVYSAKLLYEQGIKYLNHQQDTGILSLRSFKESLQPEKFLKKYTIEI